jgi:hypothetical protein
VRDKLVCVIYNLHVRTERVHLLHRIRKTLFTWSAISMFLAKIVNQSLEIAISLSFSSIKSESCYTRSLSRSCSETNTQMPSTLDLDNLMYIRVHGSVDERFYGVSVGTKLTLRCTDRISEAF